MVENILGVNLATAAPNDAQADEYERQPVPADKTKGLGSFVGQFAGEHVAATELLIGPLFVASCVTAFNLLVGLFIGNLLAVLRFNAYGSFCDVFVDDEGGFSASSIVPMD